MCGCQIYVYIAVPFVLLFALGEGWDYSKCTVGGYRLYSHESCPLKRQDFSLSDFVKPGLSLLGKLWYVSEDSVNACCMTPAVGITSWTETEMYHATFLACSWTTQ